MLLAGVSAEWLDGRGIAVSDLRTTRGRLSLSARRTGREMRMTVTLEGSLPRGGFVIRPPGGPAREVRVDGRRIVPDASGLFRIRERNADVRLRY